MANLSLTAGFGGYDRMAALRTGEVRPEGIDLRVFTLPPTEIFYRMCRFQEFDLSEMSMGAHCYLTGTGENPFIGIPAFPSRVFRHSMVYANVDAGVESPEDLNGKRIVIREWGMTAVVWIVGILCEEYGLDIKTVDWVAATQPRVPIPMPEGVRIRYMKAGENLSGMLDSGEVDAALIHQVPDCFAQGSPRVKRLFSGLQESGTRLLPPDRRSSDHALRGAPQGGARGGALGAAEPLQSAVGCQAQNRRGAPRHRRPRGHDPLPARRDG